MKKRLFLDGRLIGRADGVERVIAPFRSHPANPLTLDGQVIWKRNNLHLSWHRDPQSGEFDGWTNGHPASAGAAFTGEHGQWRVRSEDGLSWHTVAPANCGGIIVRDDADPDPRLRYKCVCQGTALLDEQGGIVTRDPARLLEAAQQGRTVHMGMFSCGSPDGSAWNDYRPVIVDTYRTWKPGTDPGRNPDGDKKASEAGWWRPGEPGWTGGDSFPCLIHLPEQKKYVAFYRTNIDRRTSLVTRSGRRERGVGRSECAQFGRWGAHELALRSDVDWQSALGHGKHDLYQMQVWPVADVYLGIVSAFYWEEDRNRLELAWSPDTVHWERICPYTDFIPHRRLGEFGGGCSYAACRPQEVDGEVRVYYGADNGRHNADGGTREAAQLLALFKPDRFAGLAPKGKVRGEIVTVPLDLEGRPPVLNADAGTGALHVELRDEQGAVIPGFAFADCRPITGDSLDSPVSWNRAPTPPDRPVRVALRLESGVVYALWS